MSQSHNLIPELSVVLPTYNRAAYLETCLPTILAQTFENFELVIVDDGSTDNTTELITSLNDARIVYVKQKNRGEYVATNEGLQKARADIITWVHSDDTLPLNSFRRRIDALQNSPGVDFVHGDIQKINQDGELIEVLPATELTAQDAFRAYVETFMQKELAADDSRLLVHHLTIMFRKRFLNEVGLFDTSLPVGGDLDWMLRALMKGTMQKVPGVLYNYRFHDASRSKADPSSPHEISWPIFDSIVKRYK